MPTCDKPVRGYEGQCTAVPARGSPGVPGGQSQADRAALSTAAEAGRLSATHSVLEDTCVPWGAPDHSRGAHRVVASDVTQRHVGDIYSHLELGWLLDFRACPPILLFPLS